MPKTRLVPRYPWDRARLSPLETVVLKHLRERHAALGVMLGRDEVAAHLGCTKGAVYQAMKGLVHKGWLGESGGQYSRYYFNDRPEDLED